MKKSSKFTVELFFLENFKKNFSRENTFFEPLFLKITLKEKEKYRDVS